MRSQQHVKTIRDYISANNPTASRAVLDEIRLAALKLRDFPMMGHPGRRAGTRELVLPRYPYILIYRLTAHRIDIVAALHQSRQYPD